MQGDHIKTWRRRWFVLKSGYMFRFATPDVSSSTKPRGLVDLSKVSDVTPAKDATGRNNSLMLSTPTGRVLYVADSETEQVEWLSAIEGTVQKLVRQVRARHARRLHIALGRAPYRLCLLYVVSGQVSDLPVKQQCLVYLASGLAILKPQASRSFRMHVAPDFCTQSHVWLPACHGTTLGV